MKKKNAIIIKKDRTLQIEENNVESFISQAIKSNVPVETLERLLAMRKELKAEKAKEAFISAMATFQKKCPIIKKSKIVLGKNGKVRYKYATLDNIVEQVGEKIAENNLSYTIKVNSDDKMLTATVIISHMAGHSEKSEFSVPISNEDYMTDVQKYGARATFAKRYAFINAFGILTGDEDTDGVENRESNTEILAKIEKCNTVEELKKTYAALTKEQKADEEILAKFKDVKTLINDEIPVV